MTPAGGLAFAAAACGVIALWELLAAVEQAAVAAGVARLLAPLRRVEPGGGEPHSAERRRLVATLAAVAGAGATIIAGLVAGLAVAVCVPWLVAQLAERRHERWREELRLGAPAVARTWADGLAAGLSIPAAIAASAGAGAPNRATGQELRGAAEAIALGDSIDDVLARLRRRARLPAWDTLAAAVLLQRQAGGDLAALLRALATDAEAAHRAEADARTATAQARMTARIVGGLPLAALLVGEVLAPGTVAHILSRPLSALLATTALLLEALAVVLVRRLATLEDAR